MVHWVHWEGRTFVRSARSVFSYLIQPLPVRVFPPALGSAEREVFLSAAQVTLRQHTKWKFLASPDLLKGAGGEADWGIQLMHEIKVTR